MKMMAIVFIVFLRFSDVCSADCVRGDCMEGEGRLIHNSGIIYEGGFRDGKFHGAGVLVFPNGDKIIGRFQDHYLNEQGVLFPKHKSANMQFIRAAGATPLEQLQEYIKKTTTGKVVLILLCTGVLILLLKVFARPIEKLSRALRPPPSAEQRQKEEILSHVLQEMKNRGKLDPKDLKVFRSLMGTAEGDGTEKIEIETDNAHQMTVFEAYEILGAAEGASKGEIKAAFRERIKKYHPDRLAFLDDDFKKLAREKTQRLNAAYQLLKEDKQKS